MRAIEKKRAKAKAGGKTSADDCIPMPSYEPPPNLKVLGSKMEEVDIIMTLKKMQPYGVTPLQSVQRHTSDPHYKKGGGASNLFTYAPTYTNFGKDLDMFSSIGQLPIHLFDSETINRAREALKQTNKWIMTNAPQRGLMNRVVEGLSRPKPPFKPDDYLAYVLEMFPLNPALLRDLRGKGITDMKWLRIDQKSGSGVPMCRAKVGATYNDMPGIMERSAAILSAIADGTIAKWAAENEALNVVLLRNKMDKYLLDEVQKKIRPYYSFPAHWNILFQVIWQPIAEASIMWLDDPSGKSINAHGFSWNRGGADRIIDWIKTRPPGFHAAAYSDDMIWVIVTNDGKRYVLLPDFKMMDMSLGGAFGRLTYMWLELVMAAFWDKTWKAVGELGCRRAFEAVIAIAMALLYLIRGGLKSGIAGTPEFDQVASCAYIGRLKAKYFSTIPSDKADVEARLAKGVEEGRKFLGLEIKAETLTMHEFVEGEDYPWLIFLGHGIRKFEANGATYYVPVRPYDKIVLSLVSPKGTYTKDGIARVRALMQRSVGIMVGGGWFYPELYFAAARLYNVWAAKGVTPASENDMTYAEFCTKPETTIELRKFDVRKFPTVEWFASHVTRHDIVLEATDKSKVDAERPAVDLKSLYEVGGDWKTENWSDASPAPMDAAILSDRDARKDVGATNIPGMVPAADKHIGRVAPLSAEQKRLYNDAIKAAKMARRAMYMKGTTVNHNIERGGRLAKFMAVYDEELVQYYDEQGLESLEEDTTDAYCPLTDAQLDQLHADRIAPSMIKGYYEILNG